MKKLFFLLLFFSNGILFSQIPISLGLQLNSSMGSVDDKYNHSTNRRCMTYESNNPTSEFLLRYNFTERIGCKIGVTARIYNYLTILSSADGLHSTRWMGRNIVVPIGFFYKSKSEKLKNLYFLADFDGMIITKNNNSSTGTTIDSLVKIQSSESTNWGAVFRYTPRLGISFSNRSSIELMMFLDFQFGGKKQYEKTYFTRFGQIIKDGYQDKYKNFDLNFYYGLAYVYKFNKRDKNSKDKSDYKYETNDSNDTSNSLWKNGSIR